MPSIAVPSPDITHVHLKIGGLDHASVSQLRQVLQVCPVASDVHLLVDLTEAGEDHDMTLFALLAEKARKLRAAGGETTALRVNSRLSSLLVSIGVPVWSTPAIQTTGTARHFTVGALGDVPSGRHTPLVALCLSCG